MLDEIRLRFDDAGDQHLAVRQLDPLEELPFVSVPRIRGFERDAAGARLEHDVDDVLERHIAVVGAFVVAPAKMQTKLLGTSVSQRMVERLDMHGRPLAEFLQVQARVLDVAAHRKIRAVDLQHESCGEQRRIFAPHGIRDGVQIGLFARVEVVAEEQRNHSG